MVEGTRVVTTRVDTTKVVITRDITLETKLAMVEIKVDTIKVMAEMLVMANNNNIQQPIPGSKVTAVTTVVALTTTLDTLEEVKHPLVETDMLPIREVL